MDKKEKLKKTTDYESKREKLLGEKKKTFLPWKIILIILVAAAVPASWLLFREEAPQAGSPKTSGSQVMAGVNYLNQSIPMTKAEAAVVKETVEVPVDLVKKSKLVYFEYRRTDGRIPLLAYITPSGRVVTAVSVCEPCNSTSFHIEGNQMVCNACFTRWDLETLKGISGGCLAYPPDILSHAVRDGKVAIKEMDLQNWKPRVVRG